MFPAQAAPIPSKRLCDKFYEDKEYFEAAGVRVSFSFLLLLCVNRRDAFSPGEFQQTFQLRFLEQRPRSQGNAECCVDKGVLQQTLDSSSLFKLLHMGLPNRHVKTWGKPPSSPKNLWIDQHITFKD